MISVKEGSCLRTARKSDSVGRKPRIESLVKKHEDWIRKCSRDCRGKVSSAFFAVLSSVKLVKDGHVNDERTSKIGLMASYATTRESDSRPGKALPGRALLCGETALSCSRSEVSFGQRSTTCSNLPIVQGISRNVSCVCWIVSRMVSRG